MFFTCVFYACVCGKQQIPLVLLLDYSAVVVQFSNYGLGPLTFLMAILFSPKFSAVSAFRAQS